MRNPVPWLSSGIEPRQGQLGRRRRASSAMSAAAVDMTDGERRMRDDALEIVDAAIAAVDPGAAVRRRLHIRWEEGGPALVARASDARELVYGLSDYDRIRVLSFGKASAAMALAVGEALTASVEFEPRLDGIAITKDAHATAEEVATLRDRYNISVRPASHPIPDAVSALDTFTLF